MKRQKTKDKKTCHRKQQNTNRRRKRQLGGFLNHYDLAYAGRDTVNQAAKVAPGVIKSAINDLNATRNRLNQSNHHRGR